MKTYRLSAATICEYTIGVLVVAFMTALTLKDTYDIINAYLDDNTVTYAKATWDNETLNLRNSTLCFELMPSENTTTGDSMANAWSVNLTRVKAEAYRIMADRAIFTLAVTKNGQINETALEDPAILLSIALISTLSNRFAFDIGYKKYENSIFTSSFDDSSASLNDSIVAMRQQYMVHDWFISHTLLAHRLQLLAASHLCRKFNFVFKASMRPDPKIDICDPDTVLRDNGHVLQSTHLCVPLPLGLFGLNRDFANHPIFSMSSTENVYFIPESQAKDQSWSRFGALHVEDHRLMLESGPISKSSTRMVLGPGQKNSVIWAVADIVGMFRARQGSQCTDEVSQRECWLRCQVKVIKEQCGCNPFLYRYLMSDQEINAGRFCRAADYERCWNTTREAFLAQCQETGCHSICTYIKYSWQFERTDSNSFPMIIFNAKSFFYVEFHQMEKTSSTEFYSQLGGILGLYLGFSGLTIYAFVAFVIRTVIEHRRERRAANITLGGPDYFKWVVHFIYRKTVLEREIRRAHRRQLMSRPGQMPLSMIRSDPIPSLDSRLNMVKRNPLGESMVSEPRYDDPQRMMRELHEAVMQLQMNMGVLNSRMDALQMSYKHK